MAKIQIYLPVENEKIGEPVIKVSELREWIEENKFWFVGIETLTAKSLLAAIDTEGK